MTSTIEIYGLYFPLQVGPFIRGGVIDNEPISPGSGQTIAYHLKEIRTAYDEIKITVYVYPAVPWPEPPDGAEAELMREGRRSLDSLYAAVDQGIYGSAKFVDSQWLNWEDRRKFIIIEVETEAKDGKRFGYFTLLWWAGRFVKVRISAVSPGVGRMHAVGFLPTLALMLGIVSKRPGVH